MQTKQGLEVPNTCTNEQADVALTAYSGSHCSQPYSGAALPALAAHSNAFVAGVGVADDISRTGRQLLVRLRDRLGRLGAGARAGAAEGLAACGKCVVATFQQGGTCGSCCSRSFSELLMCRTAPVLFEIVSCVWNGTGVALQQSVCVARCC
jgi:hypothetical protein